MEWNGNLCGLVSIRALQEPLLLDVICRFGIWWSWKRRDNEHAVVLQA
jgi:hypothetical protein